MRKRKFPDRETFRECARTGMSSGSSAGVSQAGELWPVRMGRLPCRVFRKVRIFWQKVVGLHESWLMPGLLQSVKQTDILDGQKKNLKKMSVRGSRRLPGYLSEEEKTKHHQHWLAHRYNTFTMWGSFEKLQSVIHIVFFLPKPQQGETNVQRATLRN